MQQNAIISLKRKSGTLSIQIFVLITNNFKCSFKMEHTNGTYKAINSQMF